MIFKLPIYMDYNATTPVDPRVLEEMLPYFSEHFGNAASHSHSFGWRAEEAVETAKSRIASLIGATAKEIILTSGATESVNLAMKGVAEKYAAKGNHIITCQTEHKAVLDTCEVLAKRGCEVTYLPPDKFGCVDVGQVAEAITDRTILISIMAANNETGTLGPISEIGRVAKDRGVLFHTDATQAVGKIPIDVQAMGIDLLSFSAHKIYGPKGTGGLYVRRRDPPVRPACQIHGGGHQRGMRSGTLNVPGIVGFGKACEIAAVEMPDESRWLAALRDQFEASIIEKIEYVKCNGHPTERLANTTNLSFAYVEGEAMMLRLKEDIAVSSGSACTSDSLAPSFVLKAMGLPDALVHSSLRFSLGRFSQAGEMDYAVGKIAKAVEELREMSPLFEKIQKNGDDSGIEWARRSNT
jgi:cysteine desulfurase